MPLVTQHGNPEVNQEFLQVYTELEEIRAKLAAVTPDPAVSPAVGEKSAIMPFFTHEINFVKTQTIVGPGVFDFQEWPIALIAGPYKLQSLSLTVYKQDVVDPDHLVNAGFHIRQLAKKREWDVSSVSEAYDSNQQVLAEWNWGDTSLRKRPNWDKVINATDGDTIVLRFASRVTPTAPVGTEWIYQAMITGHYLPISNVLFARGLRI